MESWTIGVISLVIVVILVIVNFYFPFLLFIDCLDPHKIYNLVNDRICKIT